MEEEGGEGEGDGTWYPCAGSEEKPVRWKECHAVV